MARLQDFPSVTPTSSDNLLVVQSTGQGLASVGSTLGAKMDKANPTGTGSLSLNRKANTTVGGYSVAEGYNCEASNNQCHAEGYNTTASGQRSHAEGEATVASGSHAHAENASNTASGDRTHAEGSGTTASATASHSEGSATTASGNYAHAEGLGTIANHVAQHTFGSYNVADTSTAEPSARGNYIEIVGKGVNANNRSNARTLDWSGNETLAGDLTFKGNISLNTLTTLLRGMTTFRIGGGASKTVTVVADGNSNFSFLVVGIGRNLDINPILMHIGGYVSASRSIITNITGKTGLTVDNSSTTNLNFVFTNTVSGVAIDIRLIPLFDNSFTVT